MIILKKLLFLPAFLFAFAYAALSQAIKYEIGTFSSPGYKKLGSLKGCAGIIADNYYILEQDFGPRLDFNNNIITIVTVYSVSSQKLKKRINLNELVAKKRSDINKILFCDVFTWKNQLVGIYTFKNPNGKVFMASAIICDQEGNPLKDDIDVGEFRHDYLNGSFLWQGGLIVNGRNTLSVVEDLQYRFTPDSSRIIFLTTPDKENINIRFRIYNSDFSVSNEAEAMLPFQGKLADLLDFSMNNKGDIFLLTKTYKSKSERKKLANDDDYYNEIFVIQPSSQKVNSMLIDLPGRAINTASIQLNNGNAFCTGNYWNSSVKKARGNCNGFFSFRIDPQNLQSSKPVAYELPDSVINNWVPAKDIKKGTGVELNFELLKTIPHSTGLYCIYNANVFSVTVRGTTGAMNSYSEMTKGMIICNIAENGNMKWANGMWYVSGNASSYTRTDRPLFGKIGDDLFCFYTTFFDKLNKYNGLFYTSFREPDGVKNEKIKIATLTENLETSETVENTILPINKNEYIMTLVKGVEINTMKIKGTP